MYLPRKYPIAELAISLHTMKPEHVQAGDIMAARPPGTGIGIKEAKRYLWLLVDGLELFEFGALVNHVYEPFDPTGAYLPKSSYTKFDRARYCVPLARLKIVFPSLDLNKAEDDTDAYQPFYTMDEHSYLWITDRAPLAVEGLVFDKISGVYI